MTTKNRPVLRGYVTDGTITVFCPACDTWHVHGWPTSDKRPSHRAAHCDVTSIFATTGYYIAPFTKADLRAMGKAAG